MESRSKVNVTKDQVDQVADIMKGNMNKIMEREGKLQDLELKADKLQVDSQQFQSHPPTPQYHHHHQVHPQQLAERITMLDDVECEGGEHKSCYSRYKTCCYLTVVFSVITATIVIIIYVALGGLRGGSEGLGM